MSSLMEEKMKVRSLVRKYLVVDCFVRDGVVDEVMFVRGSVRGLEANDWLLVVSLRFGRRLEVYLATTAILGMDPEAMISKSWLINEAVGVVK
ncbi:hypothetical protein Tco_1060263 [Tanacetum coccineum]